MKAAVVADGDLDDAALARARAVLGAGPWLVIAADGGATGAERLGLRPDLIVGDADSLSAEAVEAARERGIPVRLSPADKDESDTELAVREAVVRGATVIAVLGALGGGRVEHALANVALLALPELDDLEVVLVDGHSSIRRVGRADAPGTTSVDGLPGDYVSLLPLEASVDGVTTDGLRFPLSGDRLVLGPSRGLSNELVGERGGVTTSRGRLLVVHTDRRAADGTAARR